MFWYLNVYYELSNKLSVSANMLVMDQLEIMFKHNIYGSTEINIFKEITFPETFVICYLRLIFYWQITYKYRELRFYCCSSFSQILFQEIGKQTNISTRNLRLKVHNLLLNAAIIEFTHFILVYFMFWRRFL